jgi:glycosyltransferase involved in cell wall biosynthesis
LKILLSAYACEPNKGSEPEVGWKWATTLSKLGHEVHVLTRSNNKIVIEEYLSKNKIGYLKFIYFDFPKWFLKIIKGNSNPNSYLYFFLWQVGIFFKSKTLVKNIKFDFIHHITFVSLRFPSFLCLHNIPFIFGPISGGDRIPNELKKSFSIMSRFNEFLRDLSNKYIQFSPLMNMTFKNSHKIFVNSDATKKLIPTKYHFKTKELLAIGTDYFPTILNNYNKSKDKFNICYAGNLINLKGLLIALKTFRQIKEKNNNVIFTIIGSGPLEFKLKKLAKEYELEDSIKWLGKINRTALFNIFNMSDLMLMPSLRDSGGFVILEAMSCGLPVAVLDIGGPGKIVNNECGIKIGITKKKEDQVINELASQINNLIKDNNQYKYKKIKCLERVKNFTWEKKVSIIYDKN